MGIINFGEEIFRPYARLVSVLGDQLITKKVVAVIELIKNSYDADAEQVKIKFNNMKNFGKTAIDENEMPSILIEDDGDGMTLDTILNNWLKPATPNKLNKRKAEQHYTKKGRLMQGEKGTGRFAIHKLGRNIDIFTKTLTSNEIHLVLNLSEYDPDDSNLEETNKGLTVPREMHEYKHLDEIKNKWTECSPPEEIELKGTTIKIMNLREAWSKADYEELAASFMRMVPPIIPGHEKEMKKDFDIKVYMDGSQYMGENQISFEEIFKLAPYKMTGKIDNNANLTFVYEGARRVIPGTFNLLGSKHDFKTIEHRFLEVDKKLGLKRVKRRPNIGEISFSFYAYDLTKRKDFKENELEFIRNNNVYVYRDGIRVYPFGEKDYDWLELDRLRSVFKAGAYFSYNDLLGFVFISQENNPRLKDATNRQGMMDIDGAFLDFKALLLAVVQYMKLESDSDKAKEKIGKQKILKDTNAVLKKTYDELKRSLDRINDKDTLNKAIKFSKAVDTHLSVMKERMEIVEDLSGLGMAVEKASHDALTVLAQMRSNIRDIIAPLRQKRISEEELIKLLTDLADNTKFIYEELQILQPLFRVARKTIKDVSIEACIERVKRYFKRDIDNIDIQVDKSKDIVIKTSTGLILQVLINLMDNAIYWLSEKNIDIPKKIIIKIDGNNNQLIFADNGIGVEPDISPYIFQEFFTRKANGRGLGLYIVREILSRIDAEIRVIERPSEKLLRGANFLITFSKGLQ